MEKNRLKKFVFAAATVNILLIFALFASSFKQPDSFCYAHSAKLLFRLVDADCGYRMIKPLPLLFSGALEKFTSIDALYGFAIQNVIFYFLAVILLFELFALVFKDAWQAFLGTIFFISAPPLIYFGFAYLTDMSGWFFAILGAYLTVRLFEKMKQNHLMALLVGFATGIGFLYKESALAGAIFFGVFTLLQSITWKLKIKLIFLGALGFLFPVLLSSSIVYMKFHYSFLDWYAYAESVKTPATSGAGVFFYNTLRTLLVSWIPFFAGLCIILKKSKKHLLPRNQRDFFIAGAATLLLWPLWGFPHFRIFYLSAVFLAGVASVGVGFLPKKIGLSLTICAAFINIFAVFLFSLFFKPGEAFEMLGKFF